MSRIGKKPISVPEGVKASIVGQKVEITGPKGSREFVATEDVTLRLLDSEISITPRGNSKRSKQQWGMSRTQIANLVEGVTNGLGKSLKFRVSVIELTYKGAI